MWDRKELKAKGKAAYNANKIACILAALILMVAGGIGSGYATTSSFTARGISNNDTAYETPIDDSDDTSAEEGSAVEIEVNGQDIDTGNYGVPPMMLISSAVIAIIMIAMIVGIMVLALVLNPLNVGARKFFIQNSSDHEASIGGDNVGVGFGSHYRDIVFSMLGTQLLNMLWALLLIAPGIYKAYCWRLVPFIIADNPGIPGKEARAMSAQMMDGSKWASFVLDLSFIGWRIVAAFTLGILNIVFTNPYQAATDTELYLTLKGAAE